MDALLWLILVALVAALIAVVTFVHGRFSQKQARQGEDLIVGVFDMVLFCAWAELTDAMAWGIPFNP